MVAALRPHPNTISDHRLLWLLRLCYLATGLLMLMSYREETMTQPGHYALLGFHPLVENLSVQVFYACHIFGFLGGVLFIQIHYPSTIYFLSPGKTICAIA